MTLIREVSGQIEYEAACPCGAPATWHATLVGLWEEGTYARKLLGYEQEYDITCEAEGTISGAA